MTLPAAWGTPGHGRELGRVRILSAPADQINIVLWEFRLTRSYELTNQEGQCNAGRMICCACSEDSDGWPAWIGQSDLSQAGLGVAARLVQTNRDLARDRRHRLVRRAGGGIGRGAAG